MTLPGLAEGELATEAKARAAGTRDWVQAWRDWMGLRGQSEPGRGWSSQGRSWGLSREDGF